MLTAATTAPNELPALLLRLIVLPNVAPRSVGPIPASLLGLTMILEQPEGRNYSFEEISDMLIDAGFRDIEKKPLAGPAEIVIGHKLNS